MDFLIKYIGDVKMACQESRNRNNTFQENRYQENYYTEYVDQYENCNEDEEMMRHVHEYESSVKLAEECDDRHNHRVAGVTGEAIFLRNGNHVHKVNDNTDFLDHHHRICDTTGPAIPIPGTDKHIHLLRGMTTEADNHRHQYLVTTQIEAPLV